MVKLLHSRLERFAKLRKLVPAVASTSGYVYVSHMPAGLEEDGLRKFFSQFGKVLKVKVSRSKKTGRSKGYSFVEFEEKEPARIAANTMHGFLLFGKQLVCQYLDEVHKFTMFPNKKNVKDKYPEFKERYNSQESLERTRDRVKRLIENEKILRQKLEEAGISYNFPGYAALVK
jgi:nucleolar protein 15